MTNGAKIKNFLLFSFPFLLFLFNFITKLIFATCEGIGLDEPFSIYHAQFNFETIIAQLKNYNNPPLFELILHVWIKIFGISPLSVRMLPLLFASLAPVALFFFGKRFFSLETAIVSSLLLSLSDLLFYYSHDCRVYSLFLLLSILSMHFFLKVLSREKSKRSSLILFVLFSSLLIYGHYFGVYILFFQGIYLLLFYKDKWLKFLVYYSFILLFYLPHLYPLLTRMKDSVKRGTWIDPPSGIESLYNMLWSFCNFPFITVACIIILVLSLIKLLQKKDFLQARSPVTLLLIWFLLPYFGIFIMSYWVPTYISRYLIFVLPAFYLLLVICIRYLINNATLRYLVFFGLLISFGATIAFKNDKKEKSGEAVKFIVSKKDPGTLVIISGAPDNLAGFAYYYRPEYFSAIGDNKEYSMMESLLRADHIYSEFAIPVLRSIDKSKYKKVIYYAIGEAFNEPNGHTLNLLNTQYSLIETKEVQANDKIYLFQAD